MATLRTLILVGLSSFMLLMAPAPCPAAPPTLTLAEQEVMEALLQQYLQPKPGQKLVITDELSARGIQFADSYEKTSKSLRDQAKKKDTAFKAALEDFLQKNRTPVKCEFPTNAPKWAELVSTNTVHEFFSANRRGKKPDGWELFYQRFPGSTGLISMSRAGIDPKATVAIIYLGQQSHWLAGGGRIHVLRREGKKWVLAHESIGPEWVS